MMRNCHRMLRSDLRVHLKSMDMCRMSQNLEVKTICNPAQHYSVGPWIGALNLGLSYPDIFDYVGLFG